MSVSEEILAKEQEMWRVLDVSESALNGDVYVPFVVEELECGAFGKSGADKSGEGIGSGTDWRSDNLPLLHIWRHERALVLGLRDRRLPHAAEAMSHFAADRYSVAVRNSGGAAVPLDAGVVNVSLVLPSKPGIARLHDDFARMAKLISDTVAVLSAGSAVQAGEVAGAYCPGDYDLSIGGRKFCGIAQRRRAHGYTLQAFVVVEGDGAAHAQSAADFYRIAGGAGLQVARDSTASLQQLIGQQITVSSFVRAIRQTLLHGTVVIQETNNYDHYNLSEINNMIKMMKSRYESPL